MIKISVITATYNAAEHLPSLIKSLQEQTDKGFEWVVADGKSNDGTLELITSINDLDVVVTSEADFGIYDALNRGILKSKGEFYLVVGADDYLYPEAIENFKKEIDINVDVVTAYVKYRGSILGVKKRSFKFLDDAWSYVGSHSVGCLFRKDLHNKFGLYSKKFPIAADQYFIKKIIAANSNVIIADFIAGEFGSTGVSSNDIKGHLSETFRVQYETEVNKKTQIALYIVRLIKNKLLGNF